MWSLCCKSAVLAYLKLVLPCSYCSQILILERSVFLPHTLHLPVHPFGCLLSLRTHLPIMFYSSASLFSSLSPAAKIQRANPGTCGIPPHHHLLPTRNDVYQSDSIGAALSACTLLIPSVFAARNPREAALRIPCSEAAARDAPPNTGNDTWRLGIVLEIMFIYCVSDARSIAAHLPRVPHCSGTCCSRARGLGEAEADQRWCSSPGITESA